MLRFFSLFVLGLVLTVDGCAGRSSPIAEHDRRDGSEAEAKNSVSESPVEKSGGGSAGSKGSMSGPEHGVAVESESESEPERGRSEVPPNHVVFRSGVQPGLVAFARELEEQDDGTAWVGPLEGNGGRGVVLYLPPEPDPAAEFRLVYHFHGTYSEHIEKRRPGLEKKKWVGWNRLAQTLEGARALQAQRSYNVVLVYPVSAGKRREPGPTGWNNRAYDRMWMRPAAEDGYDDAFDRLHQEVLDISTKELGVHPSKIHPKVLAEGHSAGGIALLNIAEVGTPHVGEYLFLDASFQDWADGCVAAVREARSGARVSMVITDGGIADPFGKRDPWCAELEEAAQAWPQHRAWCEADMERTPSGFEVPCKGIAARAEDWPDYQS